MLSVEMEGGFIAMVYKERNGSNVFLVPGNLEVNLHSDHGKNGTVEFPVYSLSVTFI